MITNTLRFSVSIALVILLNACIADNSSELEGLSYKSIHTSLPEACIDEDSEFKLECLQLITFDADNIIYLGPVDVSHWQP